MTSLITLITTIILFRTEKEKKLMMKGNPKETQTHVSHVLTVDRRHVADNSNKSPCEANKRHRLRLRGLQKTANSFLPLPLSKTEEGF